MTPARLAAFALLAAAAPAAAGEFETAVRPVLAAHCVGCHGPDEQKGDLRLDTLPTDFTNPDARAAWQGVLRRVEAGTMPPAKRPRPKAEETAALAGWVGGQLAAVERQRQRTEGRVPLRRLNRTEYENVVHDLLGVRVPLKDLLPEDPVRHGFDNSADALTLSAVHLQRYLQAAEAALAAAVVTGPKPVTRTTTYRYTDGRAAAFIGKHWLRRPDGAVVLFSANPFPPARFDTFRAPAAGTYTLRLTGYAYQAKAAIPFALIVGDFGQAADTVTHGYYEFPPGEPTTVTVTAHLQKGDSLLLQPCELKGFNPYKKDPDSPATYPGPGLAVSGVEVTGPITETWPPRGHALLFGDLPAGKAKGQAAAEVQSADPDADARRRLPAFLAAAFRRPVTAADAEPYLALFAAERKGQASFHQAMLAAATAAMCSPDFLFLRERPGRLDDHALAARLALFLGRTGPDAELLALAAANKLADPAVLRAQTDRLLAHPNAGRFVADFTDAWLDLRNIAFTTPDRTLYPEFDPYLQHSMLQETRAFVAAVLAENRPADTFLVSDFAVLNERLARHYGVPGVAGVALRKVPLAAEHGRGGLLTQGAVLKVSANGTNTSPVVRGVYVLERFLGTTPPPPPPGVPAVEPDVRGAKTVRELLAKHRNTENCAGCHRLIDPPGFALEGFDVIGGRRDRFREPKGKRVAMKVNGEYVQYLYGLPVDASGELADGRRFADFAGFQTLLLADRERFARCLAEKLVAFATGGEVGPADAAAVRAILAATAASHFAVRDLVHAVVQSDLFRTK